MTKNVRKQDCSLNMRMTTDDKVMYMKWAREAGFRSTAQYFRVAVFEKRQRWKEEIEEAKKK